MTITEVSKRCGLSADTLRYYERIGLIPTVTRGKTGIREYTEEDCSWIEFTKCMRDAGLAIEAIIEYVALYRQGDETIEARKQLLLEQREQLIARMEVMQKTLDRLNWKIDRYQQVVVPANRELITPES